MMWGALAIVGLALAVALVPISLFFAVAFVRAIRPFTERLADVLETMEEDRVRERRQREHLTAVLDRLESFGNRLDRMERRTESTDSLVSDTGPDGKVPAGGDVGREARGK